MVVTYAHRPQGPLEGVSSSQMPGLYEGDRDTHYTCLDRHLVKRRKGEQKVTAQHKGCRRADAQVPRMKPVNVYSWSPLSVF